MEYRINREIYSIYGCCWKASLIDDWLGIDRNTYIPVIDRLNIRTFQLYSGAVVVVIVW